MSEQAQTYLPHDCFAWNIRHYHSQPDAQYQSCGYCKRILYFRYRSFWRNFLILFGIEPRTTETHE